MYQNICLFQQRLNLYLVDVLVPVLPCLAWYLLGDVLKSRHAALLFSSILTHACLRVDRTSPGLLVVAKGEYGPRRSSSVTSRWWKVDSPAPGGGQRPNGLAAVLRLWRRSAVSGRHWGSSISTQCPLLCQVKPQTFVRSGRLNTVCFLEGDINDVLHSVGEEVHH